MEHRKIYYRPYGYTENFHLYRWNIGKYIIDLMAILRTFIYTDGKRKIYYRPYGYTENFHPYRWNIRKYIIDLMATLRTFIYTDGKRKIHYRPYGYTENFHLYRWNIGKYIIDLMATLRTFNMIPETYELFTWQLIEADTKITLYCNQDLQNVSGLVVVRSPSGDVDYIITINFKPRTSISQLC